MEISHDRIRRPASDPAHRTVIAGLLGVAERVMELAGDLLIYPVPGAAQRGAEELAAAPEPANPGWYRDRDGDIWQKTDSGWRLCLQRGVAVDGTIWDWRDGHVRDYGPFVPVPVAR
ncbi:hypothetical protein [Nocardia mexicana]|uniref:Uncharacterized protein n=1 Tax=Nocardia mexicana TaxID=279262 RepID=A0A370H3D0_9NOCA|nr:hypothetical protein [Nocardia mexicana]RDI49672.1 hypothetical protein DFR68_106107 [Nocardia mexicana]